MSLLSSLRHYSSNWLTIKYSGLLHKMLCFAMNHWKAF